MEKMLTVAFVVRPAEGGMKTHLLALLAGLDTTRFTPVVLCPQGTPIYKDVERTGVRVIPLNIVDGLKPISDVKAALALRKILKELKPDIVHIHGAKAGLVGRYAVMSKRRPKVILTYHSFVCDERTGPLQRKLYAFFERFFLKYTDRIIAVSQALKDELVADLRLPNDLITVIYNGIEFVDNLKISYNVPRIGMVSRLAPQKGVEYFVRAAALVMAQYPQLSVSIVGDGPYKPNLRALATSLSINEGVDFLGYKSDITEVLSTLDILVLPSLHETFGLILVEAMSQKVAVVASRTGGIPEIIEDGKTGLLTTPGDPHDIAEKIIRLIENRDYARQLSEAASESVRRRFTLERMVGETQSVYESTVTQRRKVRA